MRQGHTLLELSAALFLASLAASAAFRGAAQLRDALAVTGAREAVAGLVAEARRAAVASGGARVRVEAFPARAWIEVGDSLHRALGLEAEWGVSVVLARGRTGTTLRYDALGLGQVASETLRLRRGGAERALVISGYGRVRRP